MLKSPYPYFGGKSKVADVIWKRLGDVTYYVEPFLGSGAVWLAHPDKFTRIRTAVLNDLDGFIPNFWRAVQHEPQEVAKWADNPAFECDLHARHLWLVGKKDGLVTALEGDPDYYDAKIAGWWVWGMSQWIGGGFCSGAGPWISVDGKLVKREGDEPGIQRRIPHAGDAGRGIKRQNVDLVAYMNALAEKFREARVMCGDWKRVMTPSVLWGMNERNPDLSGVVLDPPYAHSERDNNVYTEDHDVDAEVRSWALANGANPNLRIAYCTYIDQDEATFRDAGWDVHRWKANGGYGSNGNGRGRENANREVVYFSPHCVKQTKNVQIGLFDPSE